MSQFFSCLKISEMVKPPWTYGTTPKAFVPDLQTGSWTIVMGKEDWKWVFVGRIGSLAGARVRGQCEPISLDMQQGLSPPTTSPVRPCLSRGDTFAWKVFLSSTDETCAKWQLRILLRRCEGKSGWTISLADIRGGNSTWDSLFGLQSVVDSRGLLSLVGWG